jgi:hypothetical protein
LDPWSEDGEGKVLAGIILEGGDGLISTLFGGILNGGDGDLLNDICEICCSLGNDLEHEGDGEWCSTVWGSVGITELK